jgi:hypothetical protein
MLEGTMANRTKAGKEPEGKPKAAGESKNVEEEARPIVLAREHRVGPAAAPPWVLVVGAVFGAVTLVGFFVFAYLAATAPEIVCNSYNLLAPVFSLGVGLSSAFLGGAAAVNGKIKVLGISSPVAVAMSGGIAALAIAFILFNNFAPDNCRDQTLIIQEIPLGVASSPGPQFWTRRIYNDPPESYQLDVRIDGQRPNKMNISMTESVSKDGKETRIERCRLLVILTNGIDAELNNWSELFNFHKQATTDFSFQYLNQSVASDTTKAVATSCMKWSNSPIQGPIIISSSEKRIAVGQGAKDRGEDAASEDDTAFLSHEQNNSLSLIATALAGNATSFTELSKLLSSSDDITRVAARRFLSENFRDYSGDVVDAVTTSTVDKDLLYLADLISALTGGMVATDPTIAPGQSVKPGKKRNFSKKLPYIGGYETQIVALTGHADQSVKKQARRLIQRYPYDGFKAVFDNLIKSLPENCSTRLPPEYLQAQLYAGVFFYYNRIIDHNYSPTLSEAALADAKENAAMALKGAECLRPGLKIDAAVIHYGLAVIFSQDRGHPRPLEARVEAKKFLEQIKSNEANYYLQFHVIEMKRLANV